MINESEINVDKQILFGKVLAITTDMLNAAKRGAADSQSEANLHVGAMASRYDTFKEEAQYLNAGFQKQIAEFSFAKGQVEALLGDDSLLSRKSVTAVIGSIICLEEEQTGNKELFAISPALGGEKITVNDQEVTIVTPNSPLGRELLGKRVEDEVIIRTAKKTKTLYILALG